MNIDPNAPRILVDGAGGVLGRALLARLAVREVRKPVLQLPLPGAFAAAVRAGHATAPGRAVGRVARAEWLRARGTHLP
jgi:hypothetical protein